MSLAGFIQDLTNDEIKDVVWSTPPEKTVQFIPAEDSVKTIQYIPAEVEKPKIKLKLNLKNPKPVESSAPVLQIPTNEAPTVPTVPAVTQPTPVVPEVPVQPVEVPVMVAPQAPVLEAPVEQPVERPVERVVEQPKPVPQPVAEPPKAEQPKPLTDDDIFLKSGTELSKKALWMEYYEKARRSRKDYEVTRKMKAGRFTITPDNKVLILPDYDVVGKDPDDILKDKWF